MLAHDKPLATAIQSASKAKGEACEVKDVLELLRPRVSRFPSQGRREQLPPPVYEWGLYKKIIMPGILGVISISGDEEIKVPSSLMAYIYTILCGRIGQRNKFDIFNFGTPTIAPNRWKESYGVWVRFVAKPDTPKPWKDLPRFLNALGTFNPISNQGNMVLVLYEDNHEELKELTRLLFGKKYVGETKSDKYNILLTTQKQLEIVEGVEDLDKYLQHSGLRIAVLDLLKERGTQKGPTTTLGDIEWFRSRGFRIIVYSALSNPAIQLHLAHVGAMPIYKEARHGESSSPFARLSLYITLGQIIFQRKVMQDAIETIKALVRSKEKLDLNRVNEIIDYFVSVLPRPLVLATNKSVWDKIVYALSLLSYAGYQAKQTVEMLVDDLSAT